MKIRPALAERWETSADGLTWTFHLRKNVKFHCGAPLTAQDVKDHFDRWIDPKEAFPTRAKVASLAETRVVDEHTVVCKLKNPTLVFLNNISQTEWSYASIPHAKHVAQYGQDYGVVPASICGTGPFRLKEWSKDDRMELVRHDGYAWGSPAYDNTGAPWVDRIVFRTLPEDAARAAELEAGGIDLDIDVSPQHIARLEGRGVKVTSIPRLSSNHIGFNVEKEVFKDVRVRKAVAHAVNRQEIVQFVMKGQADVSHGFLHPLVARREHEGADAALHGGLRPRQVAAAPDRGGMDAGRGRHAPEGRQAAVGHALRVHRAARAHRDAGAGLLRQVGFDLQIKRLEAAAFTSATRAGEHDARFLPMIYSSGGLPVLLRLRGHPEPEHDALARRADRRALPAIADEPEGSRARQGLPGHRAAAGGRGGGRAHPARAVDLRQPAPRPRPQVPPDPRHLQADGHLGGCSRGLRPPSEASPQENGLRRRSRRSERSPVLLATPSVLTRR